MLGLTSHVAVLPVGLHWPLTIGIDDVITGRAHAVSPQVQTALRQYIVLPCEII